MNEINEIPKYLRRDYKKELPVDFGGIIIFIVGIFLWSFAFYVWIAPYTVHAQTPCEQIAHGKTVVGDGDWKELQDMCANEGIEI